MSVSAEKHVRRGPGVCAMRGSCGRKGMFGAELPCPDDGDAKKPDNPQYEWLLKTVCGPAYEIPDTVCCSQSQLQTMHDSFQQAAPLIASCPACHNNFRSFYCDFTCSPDQSTFLEIASTQKTSSGQDAVKEVNYYVGDEFKQGFFSSCKDVQFGATNGFAMDLIGGGAKNASSFLAYMGNVRPGLGSPFQISFPGTDESAPLPPDEITPLGRKPLNCADSSLDARCACVDCPSTCASLPYVAPPRAPNSPQCTVGSVSCLTFSLLIIYSVAILFGLSAYSWKLSVRHRQKRYERVLLAEPPLSPTGNGNGANPFSNSGTSSTQGLDGMVGRSDDMDADSGPSNYRLGRGASLLDPMEQLQPKQSKVNAALRKFFYRLGWVCAKRPIETFALAAVVVTALNIGWRFFEVETDPVRLWVSPSSESASQKHFFDDTFGPFYRPQQIFIMGAPEKTKSISTSNSLPPPTPVLSYSTLDWWLKHEDEIYELKSPSGYSLSDVCFAPAGPGTPCVIQSVSAWFGTDMSQWGEDGWEERLSDCAGRPGECLPDFGQPIDPKLVLGGANDKWLQAKSLVVTYVVSNSEDPAEIAKAEEWETTLREYLQGVSARSMAEAGVKVAFSTGVSLEEELNKSTNTDVKIVVASYLIMFLYISLTLGGGIPRALLVGEDGIVPALWVSIKRLPVTLGIKTAADVEFSSVTSPARHRLASLLPALLSINSKFSLGLFGISIVLIAVASSVGLFSLMGVRVTLIIAEVIPFLVLAVGVDNVFILVHELDRQNSLHGPSAAGVSSQGALEDSLHDSLDADDAATGSHLPAEERVARALARMGPSILLSSVTEVVAFGLGALVPMPAVRNFAIYAAGSVFLGAAMQVTVFVSAMALDLRRVESTRMDCFPCVRLRPPIGLYDNVPASGEGMVARFMRKYYAPFLLRKEVKQAVLALFGGIFLVAIIGIQHITLGLDQRLALPSESYLVPYFDALDAYLDVGPPVYFVAEGGDTASRTGQQQLCGRFTTCMELSVANSLEAERKRPGSSFLANPPASWIDDFLQWTNPTFDTCCRVRKANPEIFCSPHESERFCRPCFIGSDWDITMQGLPEGTDFMRYLQQWLISPTDENCPLGGQAAYGTAVALSSDNSSVVASHFRTYHTPLRTQSEFINALAAARRVAGDIQRRTGIKVFPYSVFYVFFDQYEHIVTIAAEVISLALVAILVIVSLLLGSWRTGGIVTVTCFLAVTSVMGIMGFWSISLNAISLVNLVISLGIAVEFCSHIARAFMGAGQSIHFDRPEGQKERDERAWTALVDVGPSVFSGITMTKLIGISVLALTRSKLLEVYYFRMWLSLILAGALHGFVFLPVLLAYAGGPGYSLEDTDEDWVTSQMRRPMDYEYAPFADSDGSISD